MIKSLSPLLLALAIFSCQPASNETATAEASTAEAEKTFNQALADELNTLREADQLAALNARPPEEYQHLSQEEWNSFKDSVYTIHTNRLKAIFGEYGYPGYDQVGEQGEKSFWLMVQHADHDPAFQQEILEALAVEVKEGNADGRNFGLLTDRVKLNTGQKQVYGTQVTYRNGQAIPKPLADSANVNARRAEVGLDPLEEYLNVMTTMHFEMNKESLQKRGITEPKFYEVPQKQE